METSKGLEAHPAPAGPRFELLNEDCVSGMRRRLSPGEVSVIVTSPPYNIGVGYGRYDDNIPREKYIEWIRYWAVEVKRALSDDGSLFLNISGKPSDPSVPFEVLASMKGLFVLQNTIHWIKSITIERDGKTASYGHYKPINSPKYLNDCHEYIFHLTHRGDVALDRKAAGVPYEDKTNISRWKNSSDLRCRGNTWFIPYKTIKYRDRDRPHPATFPVELAEMCFKIHGLEKIKLAMDPFLGIGHSAVAAKSLNLPFIGFEIDSGYLEEARKVTNNFRDNGV